MVAMVCGSKMVGSQETCHKVSMSGMWILFSFSFFFFLFHKNKAFIQWSTIDDRYLNPVYSQLNKSYPLMSLVETMYTRENVESFTTEV